MADDTQILADSKSAEAVQAASVHAEAIERAREAQMISAFAKALDNAFGVEGDENRQRFVNISRVPLICQSIVGINKRLGAIEGNIMWGVRLVVGAVLLALVYMVVPH